jgi:hypothetical protein
MDATGQRGAGRGRLPLVRSEGDILRLALEVAARSGDPSPELIEHTTGTREAATKTTGSWVHSDEPSKADAHGGSNGVAQPVPAPAERERAARIV